MTEPTKVYERITTNEFGCTSTIRVFSHDENDGYGGTTPALSVWFDLAAGESHMSPRRIVGPVAEVKAYMLKEHSIDIDAA